MIFARVANGEPAVFFYFLSIAGVYYSSIGLFCLRCCILFRYCIICSFDLTSYSSCRT